MAAPWPLRAILATLMLTFPLFVAVVARHAVARPLRTLSNFVAALREEDFSFSMRSTGGDDPLSQIVVELNGLADTLREQRLGALEASALLRKIVQEIEVAIFTFDAERRLRLVNRDGERLLDAPSERVIGRTSEELGLAVALAADTPAVIEIAFPIHAGRYEARRSVFRQRGEPHQLLVLADVSRALRQEERGAWQRLIRVLGHELNNSLTPIKSIAASLEQLLARDPLPKDWAADVQRGLGIVRSRSESLARFMDAYARLARLPRPTLRRFEIRPLVERVVGIETRLPVMIAPGVDVEVEADPDQIEQLLINLVRNGVDAALETKGGVSIAWSIVKQPNRSAIELLVEDEGPGLPQTDNLFVPFFTTKPGGSGIGLVLARQVAEAHGGSLTLSNRESGQGCRARLLIPFVVDRHERD